VTRRDVFFYCPSLRARARVIKPKTRHDASRITDRNLRNRCVIRG
jgi:hypothetical protein